MNLTKKGEVWTSAEASKVSKLGVRELYFVMFSAKYTYDTLGQLREEGRDLMVSPKIKTSDLSLGYLQG
jgi:hypothetical protein